MIAGLIISLFLFSANFIHGETLTFAQAAELAIAASVDLSHSRSTQTIAEGAWRWGIREYFPKIGINISENDRLQQIGADSFVKNYGITLDQLIFDGGRTSMSRRLERMELELTSARLDRMASDIAEAAIAAYRNVLSSRAILDIKKTALSVLEEQRMVLNEEVQLGLALEIDLANADINLADAKLDVYSLQLDLEEMERQFAELLGLDYLPVLAEKVDIHRSSLFPLAATVADIAREKNPDLVEARYSITKRKAELKYISNSWIPTLRLTGSFGLTGQNYPLTRYNWSVGITVDISSPWFQNRFGAQAGWEPPHDRTAMLQNSFTPLPDPASRYGVTQARLALSFEQEKYAAVLERIGRVAHNAVEKCKLAEQKRILALESSALGAERCRIEELRLELGQITRLKLMEVLIEQTQRDINLIQAATALLEAERELERFLDLKPGELAKLVDRTTRSNL
ncbi:MAG: TolC family protein [Treponema sp.]|nr:TolC family protein [Treponema sp.]